MTDLRFRIMEKELNIVAILKDKPRGIQLFDLLHNVKVKLDKIESVENNNQETIIWCEILNSNKITIFNYSHIGTEVGWLNGLQILKPSKEMRDWSKFAWKKGDVLKYTDGERHYFAIFEAFQDEEYTAFKSRYNYSGDNNWLQFNSQSSTNYFIKVSDADAKLFINEVENYYGGKLNLETLEIEKPKPQFKDGDIIKHGKNIYIVQNFTDFYVHIYAGLIGRTGEVITRRLGISSNFGCSNLATDSEKQQLFAALEKEGKAWDAEKKQIVDLPKKYEFKPMDWCLMRDFDEKWKLCQFGFKEEEPATDQAPYNAIGGNWYNECIPYNDQTAHLLGTTEDWKGGEE